MRLYLIYAAAAFGLLANVGPAASMAFTLDINSLTATSTNPSATGASGSVLFDFTDVTGGVQLDLTITNTTGTVTNPLDTGATESRLTGFFFDRVSDLQLTGNVLNSPLDMLAEDFFFPGVSNGSDAAGNFSIGICDKANCKNGDPKSALDVGDSSTGTLTFGTSSTATVIADVLSSAFESGDANAALRFQAVNGTGADSDKLLYTGNVSPVPLPATLPLLLGALGLFGVVRGRQRTA